ncbi:MAG: class B sortase, partial [Ruminiclostridium sp.]|nr:class B sortase [Ruminiclostridium sp.]
EAQAETTDATAEEGSEAAKTEEAEAKAEETVSEEEQPEGVQAETTDATVEEGSEAAKTEETPQEVKKPNIFLRIVKFIIPWKGDDAIDIARKLIVFAAIGVCIYAITPLLSEVNEMHKDEKISQEIAQIYVPDIDPIEIEKAEAEGRPLPSFESLLAINSDVIGFIQIDGTNVSYPVVKYEDNDYYLNHDIYGNQNLSGTIMMDYRNEVSREKTSDNLVIYGHNMAIGTYFAGLNEYWRTCYDSYDSPSMSTYKNHPVITFNTIYEQSKWKIFAVGLYNTNYDHGEVFDYTNKHDFTSREDFNSYIIEIMDRSDIFTDIDLQYGDDILTLSTCVWPYPNNEYIRLAVFARKAREGESEEVNVDVATVNHGVKRWKWVYDHLAEQMGIESYDWFYSSWDRRKLLSY